MEAVAVIGLSSSVKFSEVFLWDDVMDGIEKAAYRQNKKKYLLSDDDEDVSKDGDDVLEEDSLQNGCEIVMEEAANENNKTYFHSDNEDDAVVKDLDKSLAVDCMESGCGIPMEEAELTQQMNAMGLPLSFNSSKMNTTRAHRGSIKSTHLKFSQSYRNYADAVAVAGSFRVSAVNNSDPKSTYLELTELAELTSTITSDTEQMVTDVHSVLNECSSKIIKKTASDVLGIDPAAVISCATEPDAVSMDDKKELGNELGCENVEAFSPSDHSVGVHFSNGVQRLLLASSQSSDALEESDWPGNLCYGEFEDWRIYWDNDYQQYYYFNINTTESTWEPPLGMEFQPPDGVEISQEHVVGDCISGIDDPVGELMDEDETLNCCSASARKNRKSRKSRSRKTSSGIVKGDVTKYWCQRYYLFSRFDDGIKMDKEGWYSVTPEKIAEHHAYRCGTGIVLDLFTGVGGNAIQFAQRSELVIAVDIDPRKIAYALHNAAIYGVDNWIDFIQGDSFAIAPMLKADTVFLSPPWGGPEYARCEVYDLKTMLKPYDGYYLFNSVKHIAPHIVMFLPRNVDVGQLVELAVTATPPWSLEVEKNFLNGKLKAVTAYFMATQTADKNYNSHQCQTD